jgi:hypothetical protein
MDMSFVVTYIGLICDPVGGVGFVPAPVNAGKSTWDKPDGL